MKIACIGAGYFARFHVEAWLRIPEVELTAICDLDIEKAKALATEFGVKKIYSSVSELLSNEAIEIIDIITPPETHLALCHEIAKKEKTIICQKPLAPSLEEAREMISVSVKHRIRLIVHENFRFQPWYPEMKKLIDAGAIGKLHTLQLRMRMGDGWGEDAYLRRQPYFQNMPRLLIYETGVHYIDVFRFLFGEISSVYARLRRLNPVIKGEDEALVLFDFKQGGRGILDANRFNESTCKDPRYTFGTVTIEGDKGTIRLYEDGKITIHKLGQPESEVSYQHSNKNFGGDCVFYTNRYIIDCLLNNSPCSIEAETYFQNLKVQEAIYRSNQEGKEIKI